MLGAPGLKMASLRLLVQQGRILLTLNCLPWFESWRLRSLRRSPSTLVPTCCFGLRAFSNFLANSFNSLLFFNAAITCSHFGSELLAFHVSSKILHLNLNSFLSHFCSIKVNFSLSVVSNKFLPNLLHFIISFFKATLSFTATSLISSSLGGYPTIKRSLNQYKAYSFINSPATHPSTEYLVKTYV